MDHIQHLSALPGAGKTYHFISVALNHIDTPAKDANGKPLTLVYCAPTLRLLFQTAEALISEYQSRLTRQGLDISLPEDLSSIIFLPRNLDSEAEAFQRSALKWAEYITSLAYPIANEAVRSYLGEDKKYDYHVPDFSPKRIIFLTHDLFAAVKKFPRASELVVYFDEARMCTSSVTNGRGVKVSKGDMRVLQSMFRPKPLKPDSVFGKLSGVFHPDEEERVPISLKDFKTLLKHRCHPETLKSLSMFEAIWNSATNPRLDSFTKIYSEEELVAFETEVIDVERTSGCLTEFIQIKAPGKLFHGFHSVTLLSAFFETSEMKYLLERSIYNKRLKELYTQGLPLKDAKSTAKEEALAWYDKNKLPLPEGLKSRTKQLVEHRHPKLVLVPILSNADTMVSLKSLLVDIVVSNPDVAKLTDVLVKKKLPSRTFLRQRVYPNLDVYLVNKNALASVKPEVAAFVEAIRPHPHYAKPLRFLVDVMMDAVNALEAARVKKGLPSKPEEATPLIVTNTSLKTYVEAGIQEKDFGTPQEYLAQVFEKQRQAGINNCIILRTKTQGVNSYQSHRYVGFFAALNPSNTLATFYSEYIPDYDIVEDMTIEVAVQAICRSSVRDAKSRDTVYCFVPTREVARRIQEKLNGLPTVTTSVMTRYGASIFKYSPAGAPEKWKGPTIRPELKKLRDLRLYYETKIKVHKDVPAKVQKLKAKHAEVVAKIKKIEATGSLEP